MAPKKIPEAAKSRLVTIISSEEKVRLMNVTTTSSIETFSEKATDVNFNIIKRYSFDDNGGGYLGL